MADRGCGAGGKRRHASLTQTDRLGRVCASFPGFVKKSAATLISRNFVRHAGCYQRQGASSTSHIHFGVQVRQKLEGRPSLPAAQGSPEVSFPGCMNVAGKLRQL